MITLLPNNPNWDLIALAMMEIQRALDEKVPRVFHLVLQNSIEGYVEAYQIIGYDLSDAKILTNLMFQSNSNGVINQHLYNSSFHRTIALQAENTP